MNPNSTTYNCWLCVLRPLCVNLKDGAIPVLFPGWVWIDPECLLFDQLPIRREVSTAMLYWVSVSTSARRGLDRGFLLLSMVERAGTVR